MQSPEQRLFFVIIVIIQKQKMIFFFVFRSVEDLVYMKHFQTKCIKSYLWIREEKQVWDL